MGLNSEQQKAVFHDGNKPLLIEAGPGSGKTRVLTQRVEFLLNQKNVDPESLLVITFSRKATNELKARLAESIPAETINKMQISTIHGFCFDLLKKYNDSSYQIIDDDYGQKKVLFLQKHKDTLGFKNECYASNNDLKDVMIKYDEYSTFKVKSDKLIQYIENNREIRKDYIDFVRKHEKDFPYREVKTSKEKYKKDWYNAKYLQTAKSYPIYLDLLNKNYLFDYDTLQIKALEFLEKNPITQYRNILIDEFQDTNPIQFYIFEKLLQNYETFTAVGDIDQRIYGFRGAIDDYFKVMRDNYDCEVISLNKNYRSTDNIVDLTESFIEDYRDKDSKKDMVAHKEYNNQCYYIENEDNNEEGQKIGEYIEKLKKSGKIKNYSDVAILMRSVKFSHLTEIIEEFKKREIPYNVRNFSNIFNNDDIKSFITLFHYILPKSSKDYFFGKFEREWLNLKAFTGGDNGENTFTPTLWKLSSKTCLKFDKIQDDFEKEAIETTKQVHKEVKGIRPGKLSFCGIFNDSRSDEMLEEIFTRTPKPKINLDLIENKEDKEFFMKLDNLKSKVEGNVGKKISEVLNRMKIKTKEEIQFRYLMRNLYYISKLISKNDTLVNCNLLDDVEEFKKLLQNKDTSKDEILLEISNLDNKIKENHTDMTILDIFYKILEITNYFENTPDENSLNNFSIITESIYNFENIIDEVDIIGYFNFLQNNIEEWEEKEVQHDDGVQIMTIHKSKGLEFPVVIVPALQKDKFPKKYVNPAEKDWINGRSVFYTPNSCLEYKINITDEINEKYHYDEELRIIYVALTRAQDTLLLSFVEEIPEVFEKVINNEKITLLNFDGIENCQSTYEEDYEKPLNMSYTTLESYHDCPYRYRLLFDLNFKVSDKNEIRRGTAIHNAFNKINIAKIKNPNISDGEIDKIILDVFNSTSNISKIEEDYDKFRDDIHAFYNNLNDIKILESEYEFNILEDGYSIGGSIDLIYEKDGKIGIIDYKDTIFDYAHSLKYKNQLSTYLFALKQDPNYSKKNIEFSGIYAVQSQKLIDIHIMDNDIYEFAKSVDENVSKIKNKEFDKKDNCKFENCEFRFICKSLDKA